MRDTYLSSFGPRRPSDSAIFCLVASLSPPGLATCVRMAWAWDMPEAQPNQMPNIFSLCAAQNSCNGKSQVCEKKAAQPRIQNLLSSFSFCYSFVQQPIKSIWQLSPRLIWLAKRNFHCSSPCLNASKRSCGRCSKTRWRWGALLWGTHPKLSCAK